MKCFNWLIISLLMMIGTLWVSDTFAQQKQYDLDTMNFADIAPHQEGEAILIVEGLHDYTGNYAWSGRVVGSDSASVSYRGSGMDAIVFPCEEGKPYSLKFEQREILGLVNLYLSDNTGINLVADTGIGRAVGNHTVTTDDMSDSLSGTCGKAPDDTDNLIDYLYDYHTSGLDPIALTPKLLDAIDAARAQEGDQINMTGLLKPQDLHEYLIKTPSYFPSDGRAMMIVRYGDRWTSNVMAGGDGASYDGFGDEDLDFRCAPGDLYSVSVHKLEREFSGSAMLRLAVITKDKILDVGETEAKYGSVYLSGNC